MSGNAAPTTVSPSSSLAISRIFLEPEVRGYSRGMEILARYLEAKLNEVPSHRNTPGLHDNEGLVKDWVRIKKRFWCLAFAKAFPSALTGLVRTLSRPGLPAAARWPAPSARGGKKPQLPFWGG